MTQLFHTTRRVEFCHTDAAGIIHFGAFFEFMEQAEHELLRSRDLSVFMNDDAGIISWPRVAARCEFRSAARFEDMLDIEVNISRLGRRASLTPSISAWKGPTWPAASSLPSAAA